MVKTRDEAAPDQSPAMPSSRRTFISPSDGKRQNDLKNFLHKGCCVEKYTIELHNTLMIPPSKKQLISWKSITSTILSWFTHPAYPCSVFYWGMIGWCPLPWHLAFSILCLPPTKGWWSSHSLNLGKEQNIESKYNTVFGVVNVCVCIFNNKLHLDKNSSCFNITFTVWIENINKNHSIL